MSSSPLLVILVSELVGYPCFSFTNYLFPCPNPVRGSQTLSGGLQNPDRGSQKPVRGSKTFEHSQTCFLEGVRTILVRSFGHLKISKQILSNIFLSKKCHRYHHLSNLKCASSPGVLIVYLVWSNFNVWTCQNG